jgi:methylglutaconyl-CoA hydratase
LVIRFHADRLIFPAAAEVEHRLAWAPGYSLRDRVPEETTMPATSCEVIRGVATITLDNPAKHNALTPDLLDSLGDHLSLVAADSTVRVVVLTHSGPTFCAGANLGDTQARPRFDLVAVLRLIQEMEKPVVARIAGRCLGGGVGLAAVCDISIAAKDARFAFSEVRLGVAPAIISVVCLPKMRRSDAALLFFSGEQFDATRAAEVGLINRSVEVGELDLAVTELVDRLLLGGPGAMAAVKRILVSAPAMDRSDAYEWAKSLSEDLFASAEATAGIAAFRERRPAPWVPSAEG